MRHVRFAFLRWRRKDRRRRRKLRRKNRIDRKGTLMACHWGFAFGDFAALYRRNGGK